MADVVELTPKRQPQSYKRNDWHERDNFETQEQAVDFGRSKARQYPATPYRVVRRRGRWSLLFVPAWKLHEEAAR